MKGIYSGRRHLKKIGKFGKYNRISKRIQKRNQRGENNTSRKEEREGKREGVEVESKDRII